MTAIERYFEKSEATDWKVENGGVNTTGRAPKSGTYRLVVNQLIIQNLPTGSPTIPFVIEAHLRMKWNCGIIWNLNIRVGYKFAGR